MPLILAAHGTAQRSTFARVAVRPVSFIESTMTTILQIKTLESLEFTEALLSAKINPHLQALPTLTNLRIEAMDEPAMEKNVLEIANHDKGMKSLF